MADTKPFWNTKMTYFARNTQEFTVIRQLPFRPQPWSQALSFAFFAVRQAKQREPEVGKTHTSVFSLLNPVKPWPNGVASSRKLRTWVYLRLRLARTYVHLRWLAMTCAHFGRDQICTQVDASFSPFGHPTRVNASWVTSIKLLLANEIEDRLP